MDPRRDSVARLRRENALLCAEPETGHLSLRSPSVTSAGDAPPQSPEPGSIRRARFISRFLDDLVRIPGTQRRIGLDPFLGFLPGVGDWLPLVVSLDLLFSAARLGAGGWVLARMLGNIALDAVIGTVPLAGGPVRSRMEGQPSEPGTPRGAARASRGRPPAKPPGGGRRAGWRGGRGGGRDLAGVAGAHVVAGAVLRGRGETRSVVRSYT